MNLLFDAHCHLQDKRIFADSAAIIGRARAKGVGAMMCCGSDENDWDAVKTLSAEQGVFISFGLHPWNVSRRTEWWLDKLEELLVAMPSAGVGEIGLDHAMDKSTHKVQEDIFLYQLRLAAKLNRSVSIHCRRAFDRLRAILEKEGGIVQGGVLHSFSSSGELIPIFEKLGLYISFSGSITHPENRRGVEAIAAVSKNRLLIETDSPDVLPGEALPGPNEPANLIYTLNKTAKILGMSTDEIAGLTWENAGRAFKVSTAIK
jgi:TatD DNase family protein